MNMSHLSINKPLFPLRITIAALCLSTASIVMAAEEPEGKVKESVKKQSVFEIINITASKRTESIQDVPMAVSAFSGDTLKKLGIQEGLNVTQHVPNMNFFAIFGEASSPSMSIRGVSLVNFSDSWEAPVSIYVDDVYLGNPSGSSMQLFDISRLEVLKGPQGTLFGRNSTGGLVNYITNNPHDDFEAKASVQFGSYNQKIVEGVLNVPLTDGIRARLAVKMNKADGWQTNNASPVNDYGLDVDTQDLNSTDTQGYRLKLAFDLGKESELLLDFHGNEADQTSVGFAHMGYLDPVTGDRCSIKRIQQGECTSNTFGTTGIAEAGGKFGPENVSSSISGGTFTQIKTTGISAKLTSPLTHNITLTSITALEEMDKFLQDDGDGVGLSGVGFNVFFDEQYTTDTKQITQELRLNGNTTYTKWVAGLYYYDDSRQMRTQNPAGADFAAAVPIGYAHQEDVQLETESSAIFGQLDYDINEDLTVVAGLRYTTDDRTYHYERPVSYYGPLDPNDANGDGDFNDPIDDTLDEDGFSGRLGLNYNLGADTLLYTSISTGSRAGGFSASYNSKPEAFKPVKQEKNTSIEAGFKTTILDGKARINGAVFKYTLKDFQAQVFETVATGSVILNAGDVEGMGAELDLTYAVTEDFEVIASLGLLDTEMDSNKSTIVGGQTVSLDGVSLPSAPEVSYSLISRYYIGNVSLQFDYSWQDKHFLQVENDPYSESPSYGIANASIDWTSEDGTWGVSFFAQNLADEEYFTYQNSLGADWGYGVWGKPRTFGLKFNWNTL
jgi:iron complex outermembrane receptor protein